jgi:pimeloyl-ACP methyl ester carboxylesterase
MLPTAQALIDHYGVYVPDLPGFGDSTKPKRTLDIDALADSLAAFIAPMNLDGRIALLGNSLACQIIAAALARHPGIAYAAVLQGPTMPSRERHVWWQLIRWRQNLRYDPPDMKTISRDDYLKCGRLRVWGTFFLGLHDRMENRLERIEQPVLVVRGEKDPICRERWAHDIVQRLPRGELVQLRPALPGVAHTLVFTAPQELARVTTAFLGAL